mgnify:CR=1 FL=1
MNIPEQYLPLMPYLIVSNSGDFRGFMKTVFHATEQLIVPGEGNNVQHGELRVGNAVIMFSQATEKWPEKTAGMYMYVEDVDGIYSQALRHGARTLMEPVKQDYGYTAGFEDVAGNHWWIVQP